MSFINMLNENKQETVNHTSKKTEEVKMHEQTDRAEDILRDAGFKIKLVTPTAFGTQIDFAKLYDEDELREVLKDFNIKIKNKSVFIVE